MTQLQLLITRIIPVLFAVLLFFVAPATTSAQQDTTPPVLVSLDYTPKAIDTTRSSQDVTVTVRITDDLSGLFFGCVGFQSPSGRQGHGTCFGDGNRISGDALDGVYQTTVSIPQFSELGTWHIPDNGLVIIDVIRNRHDFLEQELINLGFPTTVLVTTNQTPVADAGADQTVACASASGTPVTLDGSGSSDPDGDALTYTWTGPFPEGGGTASGVSPTVTLPLGTSRVTLVVSDGQLSATDTVIIYVNVGVVGFLPPLAALVGPSEMIPLPAKAFKQGSTLPLKLQLFCGGTMLTAADVAAPRIVALQRNGDAVNLETVDVNAGESNDNGILFRFSDPNWVYNLSTPGLTTGTYVIAIELPDGRKVFGGFVLR